MNVVITGATKGMGYAMAEAFAAEGANLALTARTATDLIQVKETIARKFPRTQIICVPADLARPNDIGAFAQKIKDTWDRVDVLINNAGLFYTGDMMKEDEENLEQMMAVNLFGPVKLTRSLSSLIFQAEKPHVFNICSVASQKYFPESGSYSITKYALLGYSRALREEWKAKGIKVTSVLPGATFTRSWEGATIDPQRIMQPEDVAQAVINTWKLPETALIEELVLRPPLGDL
jgi:short-subunit dehydrogenase